MAMIRTDWAPKPVEFAFPEEGQVHVWRVSLLQEAVGQFWDPILSQEELQRAARFAFERDRHTYTVTRGILRTLLGQYLALPPAAIRFVYNPFGKPTLASQQNPRHLTFNVSHSHHFSLLAFGAAVDLGIDVEHSGKSALADLVPMVCSPMEQDQFRKMLPADRERAFLRLWTHKEAILKTLGTGLSVSPERIEVILPLEEPVQLWKGIPEMEEIADWSLCELSVQEDYAAALAVRARPIAVSLWEWSERIAS
ncbi:MAG: 4-phosphopantetheinyl transferase superfamily protein [Chthonomonadales bacterium]|nr:4-phosphopantetheinyl transferase superfamily protein [Chthonomonadales bacterium]